ncbi:MAG: formylmethanofuran dehydrogenase subunit C [Candidatus Heimdallarchaeota archaeon]
MTKITLTLRKTTKKPNIPIEAEIISPDNFAKKSIDEIRQLSIWRGNKEITLNDVFSIRGDENLGSEIKDIEILLKGELSTYKRIGQKMSDGTITVVGSIGMHLGVQMSGGKIIVTGNVDDFAGANMKGGELHIKGNAGHYLGGSVRGDWRGMTKGKIKVEGNVKNECGLWMRNGLIEINGGAKMFLGMHLHNGIIVIDGNVTERAGAEMTGGVIVIKGKLQKNLPSFEFQKTVENLEIKNYGIIEGSFLEFKGDYAERKQGTLYLFKKNNKHLQ